MAKSNARADEFIGPRVHVLIDFGHALLQIARVLGGRLRGTAW